MAGAGQHNRQAATPDPHIERHRRPATRSRRSAPANWALIRSFSSISRCGNIAHHRSATVAMPIDPEAQHAELNCRARSGHRHREVGINVWERRRPDHSASSLRRVEHWVGLVPYRLIVPPAAPRPKVAHGLFRGARLRESSSPRIRCRFRFAAPTGKKNSQRTPCPATTVAHPFAATPTAIQTRVPTPSTRVPRPPGQMGRGRRILLPRSATSAEATFIYHAAHHYTRRPWVLEFEGEGPPRDFEPCYRGSTATVVSRSCAYAPAPEVRVEASRRPAVLTWRHRPRACARASRLPTAI